VKPPLDTRIHDVTDTAIWVAGYRAMESERADALFRDPLAARLAGERGRALAENMAGARQFEWSLVVRTCVIDAYIREAIADGFDAVLNLGAGLDTRPYRLELERDFRWIEVDHAKLIELKEERLRGEVATCDLERVKADLADPAVRRAVLARVASQGRKVLVLTEGVIPYLSAEEVAALARDLHEHPSFHAWIVDYTSPFLTRQMARRRDVRKQLGNAPRRFFVADWEAFFRDNGWRLARMRYLSVEGEQYGRPPPLPWWFRAANAITLGRFDDEVRRMMGYGWLEPVRSR
jgi:methyltransferase (TIGR00027 family)